MYICSSLLRKPVVNAKLKSPFRYEFGFVAHETKFLLNEFGLDKKFKDKDYWVYSCLGLDSNFNRIVACMFQVKREVIVVIVNPNMPSHNDHNDL